jgi:toxin ParE1/3/4
MTRVSLEFHPEAVFEARAARQWYAERSPLAAAVFMEEIERATKMIVEAPDRWPGFLHGTRRYLLRRFPFSVIYRVSETSVQVVAVAHAKRRPGYWKTR